MAGKGGGAWKVAYADFVTAMMAFFLVMWIVAQNKSMKEAVSGYFRDPFGSDQKPSGTGLAAGQDIPSPTNVDSRKGPPKKPLGIRRIPNNTSVGTTIQFETDSASLDDRARQRLRDILPLLRGKVHKIEIRGHATGMPGQEGPQSFDAWALSYARCQATLAFLESEGIEPARMRLSQAGSYEPKVAADKPNWRDANARVEVHMLNEFADEYPIGSYFNPVASSAADAVSPAPGH